MAGVSLDEGGSSNSYGNNSFHPIAFTPIVMPNSMQGVEFFPIHPYHIMGSAASTTPPGSPSSPSLGLSLSLSLLGSGGDLGSPCGLTESMAAFSKFLPSNNEGLEVNELAEEVDGGGDEIWPGGMDVFACDEFRMYEFKVRKCMRGRSHDWTECPFAHPGEKARRRDPRRFRYTGTACPEFRKGSCKRGDACEFAHGVFECWLHPDRYRTLSCKDGRSCKRRVCFFAHTPQQLRSSSSSSSASSSSANLATSLASTLARHSIPGSYDGSPLRHAIAAAATLDAIYNHPCNDSGISSSPLSSPSSTNLSALSPTVVARNSIPGSYDGSPLRHAIATAATLDAIYNQSCNDAAAAAANSSPSSTLLHSGPSPLSSSSLSPTLARSSISGSYDGSPLRHAMAAATTFDAIYNHPCSDAAVSSPTSTLTSSQIHSPPLSPSESPPLSPHLLPATPAHRRHLDRLHTIPVISIPSFEADPMVFANEINPVTSPPPDMSDLAAKLGHLQLRSQTWDGSRISSPSPRTSSKVSVPSPLSCCQRSSSVSASHLSWVGDMEKWNDGEEPVRVESGWEIRAAIYGKLSRDNPLSSVEPSIDWVDDLIQ